jgi:hypothetical protein
MPLCRTSVNPIFCWVNNFLFVQSIFGSRAWSSLESWHGGIRQSLVPQIKRSIFPACGGIEFPIYLFSTYFEKIELKIRLSNA